MMIVIVPVICIFVGFVFMYVAEVMPIFRMVFFHWFGFVFAVAGVMFLLYRLVVTSSLKQADKLPTWRHLINYMRRDNHIVPLHGERAYPGESFIDVPNLGLIEFLGKDCFYSWGDKKVMWGLENINFTPDPRYFNLTHLLWSIGFTDSVDVSNVLYGRDLELMGRVYLNMLGYERDHGVRKLIGDMRRYNGDKVSFKPKVTKNIVKRSYDSIASKIDNLDFRNKGR